MLATQYNIPWQQRISTTCIIIFEILSVLTVSLHLTVVFIFICHNIYVLFNTEHYYIKRPYNIKEVT
jgi:hypothetical protein